MTAPTILRLLAAITLLAVPHRVSAQADPDSVQHRNNCRLAAQVITTGHPAPRAQWAWTHMELCAPSERAAVYVEALSQIRRSTDVEQIKRAMVPVVWFRDGQLFRAALALAGDETASVPARVVAFMALARIRDPQASPAYERFTGGVEINGIPVGRCSARTGHPIEPVQGHTPLPADYLEQIDSLATVVARDRSQPLDVRTAAACTG